MKILFVSDDAAAARVLHEAVEAASDADEVVVASSIGGAIDTIGLDPPDVILLDLELAEAQGLGALARMQFVVAGMPIVVVTGMADEATALRAVKAGAEDYLLREQLHGTLMLRSLHYAVQQRRAVREARLNAQLLSQVGQAVVAMDADGVVLSWNPAAERLFGWTAAEVMGRPAVDFTGALQARDRAGTDPAPSETRLRRKLGSLFLAEVTRSPLTDESGEVAGVIAVIADITQRRAAEDALRSSEQRLRLFVEQLPTLLWTTDAELVITSALGAGLARLGLTPGSVIGRPVSTLVGETDGSTDASAAMRALGGESLSFDTRFADRWLNMHIDPLHDAAGSIIGTIGIALDVTENRRAEERHRRLIEVIEASPDYVATFDARSRVLYVNRAGREMVGIAQRADLAGQQLFRFHPPGTVETLTNEAVPHAVLEGTWTGECELIGTEGRLIPVWATIVAHRGDDGPVAFFSIVARDLTDRRRLEEQFRESQKMEAIGRLAGGVAHDFNNLLTTITGHAELLADQLADSPVAGDVETILRAAERAAGLTRKLLAFSRRQVLQPRLLDINAVVTDMAALLRRLIGTDIQLDMNLAPSVSAIRADKGQLEQVIVHLVVNARDAMPGGGRVELSTAMVEVAGGDAFHDAEVRPGTYVEIVVDDNGHGMEPSVVSRIFEPFFTTRELGRGTGLGLPTVYGIVTQSGGHIRVESEPGKGSTFRVLLPAAAAPLDPAPPAQKPKTAPAAGETVLLVEDETAVRHLATRILERRGYTVIAAPTGDEALRMFPGIADRVQLLVTDVMMPGVSGTELADRLRKARPDLPVLFTSGYTADALPPEARLDPGMAFLDKPFTPDALAHKVRELLDDAGSSPT